MAKKRSRRRQPVRAKSRRSVKSTRTPKAGATGPVTLAQARALAKVRAPLERGAKLALEPASPATVGLERRKLEKKQELERRQRIKEYKATLAIMKKRGVKGLTPRAVKGGRAPKSATGPLQVFAEGDSWFDYPVPFFGGGIIPRLENQLGVPILNLAKAGDQARYMLGVAERKILIDQFTNGCPAGGPWDAMLFSGGGNDIVDNPMALWVRDWDPTIDAKHHLDSTRFAAALAIVRAGYEDLIALRNKHSPDTHIVLHGYDFAIPDGRGVCGLGPWMKPTFDLHNFPDRTKAQEVVTEMLRQFAAMVKSMTIAKAVTYIETQGTLAPKTSSWHNELHPSSDGFDKFADMFQAHLKGLFPDRVA